MAKKTVVACRTGVLGLHLAAEIQQLLLMPLQAQWPALSKDVLGTCREFVL